jgi:hypothetical protein
LQDRVAFDNASLVGIEQRPIERMSHVTDKCAGCVAGQLRVGVQGDDVPDRRQDRGISDTIRECSLLPSPQQGIELFQFAALAFISHPHPFAGVPHPGPVKQIEDARPVLAVGLVEGLDSRARAREQGVVGWQGALGRVREIGQQGKEQIWIAITEIANLQGLEKIIDVLRPAQQGGDNHHSAVHGRYSFRKIQAW